MVKVINIQGTKNLHPSSLVPSFHDVECGASQIFFLLNKVARRGVQFPVCQTELGFYR